MNISQKCNCCEHESVCRFIADYEATKKKVLDIVDDTYYKRFIEVSIACPNFKSNSRSPVLRGENNG